MRLGNPVLLFRDVLFEPFHENRRDHDANRHSFPGQSLHCRHLWFGDAARGSNFRAGSRSSEFMDSIKAACAATFRSWWVPRVSTRAISLVEITDWSRDREVHQTVQMNVPAPRAASADIPCRRECDGRAR